MKTFEHPYPRAPFRSLTGYQREILRRVREEEGNPFKGLKDSEALRGTARAVDDLWAAGLILLTERPSFYVLTPEGEAAFKAGMPS